MKAKEKFRRYGFWDPSLSEVQEITSTDWEILNNPTGGQHTSGYKDVAIRVLLEVCGIDPDLYKGMEDTIDSAHELRNLVLMAVDKDKIRQEMIEYARRSGI